MDATLAAPQSQAKLLLIFSALTRSGEAVYAKLAGLCSERLEHLLRGWPPEQRAEVANTIHALAERLLSDDFGDFLAASRMQLCAG